MRCDCGFEFSTLSPEVVKAELARARRAAFRGAYTGLFIGLGAIAFSVYSCVAARPGQRYTIMYGAAFAGLLLAGRSIVRIVDIQVAKKWFQKH
jgi:hypothetical protein